MSAHKYKPYGWHRGREPVYNPRRYDDDAIVVVFDCCKWHVIVGKRTKLDRLRGFSQVGELPLECPCKCKFHSGTGSILSVERRVVALIQPPGTFELHRAGKIILGRAKVYHYGLIVYYDNYFVAEE